MAIITGVFKWETCNLCGVPNGNHTYNCKNAESKKLPVDKIVMPKTVRAYSDFEGHILVRLGNEEHGMDLTCAMRLLRDLRIAVDSAVGFDKV